MTDDADDKDILGFAGAFRFLSNFHPCQITMFGLTFPSVENAYQAAKAKKVEDRLLFIDIPPNAAKKLGKDIEIREDWHQARDAVMLECLRQKFSKGALRDMLLYTGDAYIEETNWWNDTYWGVCKGEGRNRLGELLMQLRRELKEVSL